MWGIFIWNIPCSLPSSGSCRAKVQVGTNLWFSPASLVILTQTEGCYSQSINPDLQQNSSSNFTTNCFNRACLGIKVSCLSLCIPFFPTCLSLSIPFFPKHFDFSCCSFHAFSPQTQEFFGLASQINMRLPQFCIGAERGENRIHWSSGFISNISQCSPKSELTPCRRGWKMENSEDSCQDSSGWGIGFYQRHCGHLDVSGHWNSMWGLGYFGYLGQWAWSEFPGCE